MKKSNKKGFTIVELVIVIAVIAILAAVLIPTFSNVVENAKKSAAMQNARNAYEEYLAKNVGDASFDLTSKNLCIKSDEFYFHVEAGEFKPEAKKEHTEPEGKTFDKMTIENGNLQIATTTTTTTNP